MNNQKGVSLIITFLVVTIILLVVLSIGTVLTNEIKIISGIGNSTFAFYAVDTGVEKTLYFDRKQIPNGATRGFCNICTSCNDATIPPANWCNNCTTTELNPGGCNVLTCDACQVDYTSPFGGSTYTISAKTNSLLNQWGSIVYGNNIFVAVGDHGTGNGPGSITNIVTSPDGLTWTPSGSPGTDNLVGITYGNGLYVALNNIGNTVSSTDGITWASGNDTGTGHFATGRPITYGNGLYVAVSYDGVHQVAISNDGINWTPENAPLYNEWWAVTFGNNLFVAVAQNRDSNTVVMTSPNGINWTQRASPNNGAGWTALTYGNGLFVAADYGSGNVMTSPDGINWTLRAAASNNQWVGIAYDGVGLFAAVAADNAIMTSPNGTTWTLRASPANNTWTSIAYGGGLFAAVADGGTDNRVMTSGDGITWTSTPINFTHNTYIRGVYKDTTRAVKLID